MTDDIRREAISSGPTGNAPDDDRDDCSGEGAEHAAMRGDDVPHTASDTTDTSRTSDTADATNTPDVLDALESLHALDTDRRAVNDRLITATMATWSAALMGVIMAINAVAYWLLGWTVLGGHAAFTWTEYWLYIGGAVLLVTLSAALLAYGQKHSGIGMWNGRQFWPDKRLLRDGRYRRIFTAYLACVVVVPVMMALIGALCAPWWPVVVLAPICGLVPAWLCRRQTEEYTRIITTPLAPDAPHDASDSPDTPDSPQGTHGAHETETSHGLE
ncbi:hypothetical protein JS528_01790 [Bifidobacterium sp. MA2]|uniref:Uncharacterized protein n=1 Tax=Bifidobacterium santillanense TaxID=2809028 RepID=A0ABS5UMG8_9BIFI|nr:hypothetical protein [Bifidobacterium santillanense]MBT1172110.1 hypothetical protein [Bifidobacterium santillanense]